MYLPVDTTSPVTRRRSPARVPRARGIGSASTRRRGAQAPSGDARSEGADLGEVRKAMQRRRLDEGDLCFSLALEVATRQQRCARPRKHLEDGGSDRTRGRGWEWREWVRRPIHVRTGAGGPPFAATRRRCSRPARARRPADPAAAGRTDRAGCGTWRGCRATTRTSRRLRSRGRETAPARRLIPRCPWLRRPVGQHDRNARSWCLPEAVHPWVPALDAPVCSAAARQQRQTQRRAS